MTRELLILRHARAGHIAGLPDRERPLDPSGESDASRVGYWLKVEGALPDATLVSPALRARTTARLALAAAGRDEASVVVEPGIYEADLGALLAIVSGHDEAPGRLLLVGHNPGLEALVAHLAASSTALPSGTLVRLEMPGRWRNPAPGCATIRARVTPGDAPPAPPRPDRP